MASQSSHWRWTRALDRARPGLLVGLLAALAGCTTSWAPRTAPATVTLQWPFSPNPAKVTFLRSLSGFARESSAGTALRAVVYGREKAERNAFVLPVAVALGQDGRMAVADPGRGSVHLFIPRERRYLRLAGSRSEPLKSPVGVAFDEQLHLYVADSSGRIFAFGPAGELLRTMTKAGAEPLRRPTGIAYSPTRRLLYVVDTLANRVHALTPGGELAFSFGGRGEGAGQFNFPTHLFRAATGELYVTDALNFRIAIFDEAGKPLGAFGKHGDGSGDLGMPKGVAVDRDGAIYVVDGLFDNVQVFDRQGGFLLTVGNRGVHDGEFWLPAGAFVSDQDELYVCDTYNHRVQVFKLTERYAPAK